MQQGQSKVFLVTGNEDIRNRNLLIENLLFYKKLKGEKPLLVNLIPNNNCFTAQPGNNGGKSKTRGLFNLNTVLEIPSVTGENLVKALKDKEREELLSQENECTSMFIFGTFPQEIAKYYGCIDHILLVIKNEYESSSYLFNYINSLYDKMIEKNLGIVVSGIKRIEDAARFYVRLRNEMRDMIDSSLSFDFIGSLDIDVNKIKFAAKRNEMYIGLFEDDSFHGNIKYINERLEGLEHFRTESFFRAITESSAG
jgi:hypothetical protein